MKSITTLLVCLFTFSLAQGQLKTTTFFNRADAFFKDYVKKGEVAYTALAKDNTELRALIALSNQIEVDKNNANTYKAFWINVYNLGVIHQIVKNYPTSSPMQISGFFKGNKMKLGGKQITLNDIENKLLRGNFKEPRFHFVLVCGAVSCPPIVNYAYTPKALNSQLEKQTKLALNNKEFIQQNDKETKISEIFSWYKQDFGTSKKNIAAFINGYRSKAISANFGYYAYNWKLNAQQSSLATNETQELSNIQAFTPSKLLSKGQFDVKLFNSIYTQTEQTLGESSKAQDIDRQNFFTSTLEFYIGVTKNARVNVGFITQARSNTTGGEDVFSVFKFEDNGDTTGTARSGWATFAPSVRIQPLENVPNFSFTSSVYLPIFKKDQQGYLDKNSVFWETKFFYDYSFLEQWQLFTEIDLGFNFGEEGGNENFANNSLDLPISAFLSYFPSSKSTIFINAQQRFFIGLGNQGNFSQNHTALGFGGKYQVTNTLNVELSYSKFVRGYNFQGLGQTFSVGLRYLSPN